MNKKSQPWTLLAGTLVLSLLLAACGGAGQARDHQDRRCAVPDRIQAPLDEPA